MAQDARGPVPDAERGLSSHGVRFPLLPRDFALHSAMTVSFVLDVTCPFQDGGWFLRRGFLFSGTGAWGVHLFIIGRFAAVSPLGWPRGTAPASLTPAPGAFCHPAQNTQSAPAGRMSHLCENPDSHVVGRGAPTGGTGGRWALSWVPRFQLQRVPDGPGFPWPGLVQHEVPRGEAGRAEPLASDRVYQALLLRPFPRGHPVPCSPPARLRRAGLPAQRPPLPLPHARGCAACQALARLGSRRSRSARCRPAVS